VNVQILEWRILQYLINNHPEAKNVSEIATDIGEKGDKGRQRVGRCCKKLEANGYIYKENKQAKYHITEKVYGYPKLKAFSFGNQAIRTVSNIHTRLVSPPEEFHINDFCKSILYRNDRDYAFQAERNSEQEIQRDRLTLLEFATRIGALVEYIMIQALRPKKALPDREGLVELEASIKGKDKDSVSSDWIENAVTYINVKGMFVEFCRLWTVKRGLAIFADKDKTGYIDPSIISKPKIQKYLIEERKKMRKMDIDDRYWSPHEMDEENFKKLTDAYANAYPEIYEKLEKLRKELPAEIESNIEMVKEQMARKAQLEKEDPHHTKCDGELVPETLYACKKCGRRLLKN
jgi:hypothetical protein